jgi:hypothetical protein
MTSVLKISKGLMKPSPACLPQSRDALTLNSEHAAAAAAHLVVKTEIEPQFAVGKGAETVQISQRLFLLC